ncbi:hypothetical protein PROFUN_07951 [Planoprotostelium fungivorum]|uniref:Uncharacterized protein n=1 Tax=Planoprotostelium fungivorum TaxID=1890364 RepID=A0A2P6NL55_9EUKA|nr:hypothetical protein PROFUN_07951 [Planoprotostelium fungivorum]
MMLGQQVHSRGKTDDHIRITLLDSDIEDRKPAPPAIQLYLNQIKSIPLSQIFQNVQTNLSTLSNDDVRKISIYACVFGLFILLMILLRSSPNRFTDCPNVVNFRSVDREVAKCRVLRRSNFGTLKRRNGRASIMRGRHNESTGMSHMYRTGSSMNESDV